METVLFALGYTLWLAFWFCVGYAAVAVPFRWWARRQQGSDA